MALEFCVATVMVAVVWPAANVTVPVGSVPPANVAAEAPVRACTV